MKRKVNTNLGIAAILFFASLFTVVDFYYIGSQLDGYLLDQTNNNSVTDNNGGNNNVVDEIDFKNVDQMDTVTDNLDKDNSCSFFDDEYCLLYDTNNIKIEYNFIVENKEVKYMLKFNDKEVSLNGMLQNYKMLDDNYLFVIYGGPSGDSVPASFMIFDLSGNILTDIDVSTLNGPFSNFNVEMKDNVISYSGKPFNFNLEGFCKSMIGDESNYMRSTNIIDKYDSLIFVKEEYNYIGGGKISKINRIEKSVFDYMKESTGYDNCQDAVNNIDSWENIKSIYSFYQ